MTQKYDLLKLSSFFEIQEMGDVIKSLDQILFAASMYYLDLGNKGMPFPKDSSCILDVRDLLENLRECRVED